MTFSTASYSNLSLPAQFVLLVSSCPMEAAPTMTDLLTIPHNIGRIIVEDGAMLCCGLLGADHFVRFCRERGITAIDRQRLIRLERLRLFAPVFRVRTPQDPIDEFHIPPREDNNWFTKGLAEDTTAVPSNHAVPDHTDQDCQGYYSVFQIDHLQNVLSYLTLHVKLDSYLDQPAGKPIGWQEQGDRTRQLAEANAAGLRGCGSQHRRAVALLCQHVSNRYFPHTQTDMRTMQTGCGSFCDAWISVGLSDWDWRREAQRWDPKRTETLYSLTPEKLRHAYEGLAIGQASCDPIEHWYPLVQFISVDQRKRLKGAALRSETMRNGAQMLRLLYKDLYGDDLPHPNEVSGTVIIHQPELEVRKDVRLHLEFVANRFGVNPQPRLCLLVEGETEQFAITRIFEKYYGAHPGTYGIEIICLCGVDNATGKEKDRFGGIIRLIDYLHHHQTFSFLILDNENRAKEFETKLLKAKSIHNNQRFVTQQESIKILDNSFEFDNFSYDEIAAALTKLAQNNAIFSEDDVASAKEDSNPGSALKKLYKEKTNYGLNKIKLAEILVDMMESPESVQAIKERPIIKILNQVELLVIRNYLPTRKQIRDANQTSGFFAKRLTRSREQASDEFVTRGAATP